VFAHGPHAADLATAVSERIRSWNHECQHAGRTRIEVHPAGTPDDALGGGSVLDRACTRTVFAFERTT
jgi:protein-L-isoaspartate(D-aspartate) O-methyltransferase